MKLQEWENLNSIEAGMAFDVDEVIDLLKQAMETSDLLFVERALLIIEGTYENGLDDHRDDDE